jgi:hypothetical protein
MMRSAASVSPSALVLGVLVLLLLGPTLGTPLDPPVLSPFPGVAGIMGGGSTLQAQEPPGNPELAGAVEGLARAWARGNAEGVAAHFARGGVSLKLDGPVRASVAPRQASAALRDFFRSYEGGEIQVVRAAPLAGTPDRGFAEIRWAAPVSGTSQAVQRSLFLGLFFDGETWRVDELRLLP